MSTTDPTLPTVIRDNRRFSLVPARMIYDTRCTPVDYHTMYVLGVYANQKDGVAWPGLPLLMQQLQLTNEDVVLRRLKRVIDLGYLERVKRGRKAGWRILYDEPGIEPAPLTDEKTPDRHGRVSLRTDDLRRDFEPADTRPLQSGVDETGDPDGRVSNPDPDPNTRPSGSCIEATPDRQGRVSPRVKAVKAGEATTNHSLGASAREGEEGRKGTDTTAILDRAADVVENSASSFSSATSEDSDEAILIAWPDLHVRVDPRLFADPVCGRAVADFLKERSPGFQRTTWADTLAGYLDGLQMRGNVHAEPIDVAGGLLAWRTAGGKGLTPAYVAGFVARCRAVRLRQAPTAAAAATDENESAVQIAERLAREEGWES